MIKATVIAISGGCSSGKTTFIRNMKDMFKDDVICFFETIRERKIESIDAIRSDVVKYFHFENEEVFKKYRIDVQRKIDGKIILLDRSLVDSYFYYSQINEKLLPFEERSVYNKKKTILQTMVKRLIKNNYDKIIIFKPTTQITYDIYRPKNLFDARLKEYNGIKRLLIEFAKNVGCLFKVNEYNPLTSFDEFVVSVHSSDYDDNFLNIKSYNEYWDIINRYLGFDNIVINVYGSIVNYNYDRKILMYSALLFSENKNESDEIIAKIKKIKVEDDFMNSRCYPTGLYKKNNVMIVGEAPGQSGRSINNTYLKPAFIYEMTSWNLRYAIMHTLDETPYITNYLKYARHYNHVTHDDFAKCDEIFLEEVYKIQPSKIIVLGNNTFSYIKTVKNKYKSFLDNFKFIEILHPASILYSKMPLDKYVEIFRRKVCC